MRRFVLSVALLALLTAACDSATTDPETQADAATDAMFMQSQVSGASLTAPDLTGTVQERLAQLNVLLAEAGAGVAIDKIEWVTTRDADQAGQSVFRTDRQLRLTSRWVPGDARRNADGDNITYMNDSPFMVANPGLNGEPPIDSSFGTWGAVGCSSVDPMKRDWNGSLNSALLGSGLPPGDVFAADIITIGFLPLFIFEIFFGPDAPFILGVTWTFIFGDFTPDFVPSDVDNNGKTDTAFKEIWYNDAFDWDADYDIETVAFHENGHAMELGHFGRIAVGNRNGKLHVSPRAAMNAIILGTLRSPLGTDNASFCGNWAQWPNN